MEYYEQQIADLQRRVAALESEHADGYVCTACNARQPRNHFYYTARNIETGRTVAPVCAPCVRGANGNVCGSGWAHGGPYSQPVKL